MQEIKVSNDKFESLVDIFGSYIPGDYNELSQVVSKALKMTCVPKESILKVESQAENMSEAIEEYLASENGSEHEKASIRKCIEFCKTEKELDNIVLEQIELLEEGNFETILAIRRKAELSLN